MRELSVYVEKPPIDLILGNFKNEKMWSKTWKFFEYDNVFVEMYMSSIDVRRKQITLYVRLQDKNNFEGDVNSTTIPIDTDHRNVELFERKIYGTGWKCFQWINRSKAKETVLYRRAKRALRIYEAELKKQAKEQMQKKVDELNKDSDKKLTIDDVYDEDMQKRYIEKYVSRHSSTFLWSLENIIANHKFLSVLRTYENHTGYEKERQVLTKEKEDELRRIIELGIKYRFDVSKDVRRIIDDAPFVSSARNLDNIW